MTSHHITTGDSRVPDLVGLAEIAFRLGVHPGTPSQWRSRGILPTPDLELAMGPVWLWARIEEWATSRDVGRRTRP